MYCFDMWGWLTDVDNGRDTDIAPPTHGAKTVGQPYPNWNGVIWCMLTYADPVIPTPRPAYGTRVSSQAFLLRIGATLLTPMYAAMATTPKLQLFRDMVLTGPVDLTNPITIADINDLVPTFMTQAQADAILTDPVTPSEVP